MINKTGRDKKLLPSLNYTLNIKKKTLRIKNNNL